MNTSFFHEFPIWLVGLVIVIILLVTLEFGYRVGLSRRELWKDADSGGGRITLTSIFAILGLMLAFTYGAGVERFDANKKAIHLEVDAIQIVFLRADLVAEPGRTELKQALLDYTRTRTVKRGAPISQEQFQEIIQKTIQAKSKLWPITERIVEQISPSSTVMPLLITSINQVNSVHTLRIASLVDRLPGAVLLMLLFVASAAVSVAGFNAGISGRISRWRMTTLALVLMGVMLVIYDFDHPRSGFIQVHDNSITRLINEMETNLAQ